MARHDFERRNEERESLSYYLVATIHGEPTIVF